MSGTATLQRIAFETSRASEYLIDSELQAQTGQPRRRFADVVLKELADNGLDSAEAAAEAAKSPPELVIEVHDQGDRLVLSVCDNGKGIPAEVVKRILNFETRTSDKTTYRAPLRGMQGNGLKTVLGIPHALGIEEPVIIEAHGVRHVIRVRLDRAGELKIEYDMEHRPTRAGTKVSLTLPRRGQDFVPAHWAKAFSLYNPHAEVRIRELGESSKHANSATPEIDKIENFYKSTVTASEGWRKFLSSDLTSPAWYDDPTFSRLVFSHVNETRHGGRDLPLGEFVRQFRGLLGTGKAKEICGHFPDIVHLSDFERAPDQVQKLLQLMKEAVTPPSSTVLGAVGKEHFRARFEQWYGVKRFWYKKITAEEHGIPFVFEVAVAETEQSGDFFSAVNFSPTFEDPLADEDFDSPEFGAIGLKGFFENAHVMADRTRGMEKGQTKTAVAVHWVCPVVEFLDRGKTRLSVSTAVAKQMAKAMWTVVQDLYKEEERRRKDAARAERAGRGRERDNERPHLNLKEAVFKVLVQACAHASGDGQYPFSARFLFYPARDLIQSWTTKELDYDYFSQNLLTQYRETHGPIEGLYYDPRGVLYEPHTGKALPLGTREVDTYEFPAWLYNKILYVEKKGLWPILEAAQFAEKYDMAVVAAEGYASEAARTLFAHADKNQDYQLFVFHDADPHGYNIARTLREATRRMPDYHVDVIDLGLKLEEALAMNLQTENFTRKKALPEGLELTDTEREYFEGHSAGKQSWIAKRVELNALTAPALVAYIEHKLQEAGVRGKVIPTEPDLTELAEGLYHQQFGARVDDALERLLSLDALKASLAATFRHRIKLEHARPWIERAFARNDRLSWRSALEDKLDALLSTLGPQLEKTLWREICGATSGKRP